MLFRLHLKKFVHLIAVPIVVFYSLHFTSDLKLFSQNNNLKTEAASEIDESVNPASTANHTEESIAQTTDRMEKRLEMVQNTCNHYKLQIGDPANQFIALNHPVMPQYSVFYFNQKKKWAYCPTYKAASTSFLHWLLRVEGGVADPKMSLIDSVRKYYPIEDDYSTTPKLLRESIKWMVVRHPFERILSAYRDKIENSTAEPFYYEKYGWIIVATYRKQPIVGHPEPTFEEFVHYLIDDHFMLLTLEEHWAPYYMFCSPCVVNYDIIVNFETLEQDVRLLMHLLNSKLQQQNENPLIDDRLEWKNKILSSTGRKSAQRNLLSYYSQLDKTTVHKLYEKYRLDFEFFGYGNASEFIAMARDS